MIAQLTPREKTLALIVGAVVAVLINVVLLNFFAKSQRRLNGELNGKKEQLEAMRSLYSEKELWAKRETWLETNQPKLTSDAAATRELKKEIEELMKAHGVVPENPVVGVPESVPKDRPMYVSVPMSIETKSSWTALIKFLAESQSREKFMVVESASLQTDPTDKTQMRGKFKIARWYAPRVR
ncbi:MAG: hypothetical protein M3463_07075 [Verrucomicrobiota bacterium]|nr:hypothetical protein [Verrucomicrobiota bacterium]